MVIVCLVLFHGVIVHVCLCACMTQQYESVHHYNRAKPCSVKLTKLWAVSHTYVRTGLGELSICSWHNYTNGAGI